MPGDSFVSFDEGSARKWDFWQRSISSNTVEQLRVVHASPFEPTFAVSLSAAINATTADSHLLQIMAGPLNRIALRRLTVYQVAAASAPGTVQWSLVRLTTAGTGGSQTITPVPHDPTDTATAAVAMALPSSKGTEGSQFKRGVMAFYDVSGATLTTRQYPILDLCWSLPNAKPPLIAAGASNGIALKQITASVSSTVLIDAEFTEQFWS